MSNPFDKDYKEPQRPSKYMKFQDGINKFRIIDATESIVGYEAWDKRGDKPEVKRWAIDGETDGVSNMLVADSFAIEGDPSGNTDRAKTFWSVVVWNYQTENIEVLNITQYSIRKELTALTQNKEWGAIDTYNITVTRTKTGSRPADVEYSVNPSPHTEIPQEALDMHKEKQVNLQALFTNDDPFEKK